MPILKQEIDLHPPGLFGAPFPPWQVAYVRSRHEKALARYLLRHGIPFYLPQFLQERRIDGRKRISSLPLFPGYVFLPISTAERKKSLESNLVVRLIEVFDQALIHGELMRLWELQITGTPLVPHPYLEIGQEVDVIAGPLKGCRGTIQRQHGQLRLVVSVTLLRRSVAATLDRESVVPVPFPSPRRELARSPVVL